MPRSSGEYADTPVALRLPSAWLGAASKIAEGMSEQGAKVTRTDVLRMAIRRGLAELKHDTKRRI